MAKDDNGRHIVTVYDLVIDVLPPLLFFIVFLTDDGWLGWTSLVLGILSAVFFLIPDIRSFYQRRKATDAVEKD